MAAATEPTILIIVGITGDLSKRKLLPAIEQIMRSSSCPETLKVIGVTRQPMTADAVLQGVAGEGNLLRGNLSLFQMDLTAADDYTRLQQHIDAIEHAIGKPAQRLFYLSVPPQVSQPIVGLLGASGMASERSKLLLEKPFGTDLASARELVGLATQHFREDQIYRIDHYLAKEMSQNLVVFRQNNSLFKQTWNKDFIESIEIVASETIGIEGRSAFYEQTGALRDIVQSHLLQLAALTLAALPGNGWQAIPGERLKALKAIRTPQDIAAQAVRGQYQGYRDEAGNPRSAVETFVSLTLFSDDLQWQGVPIRLVTGKALDRKATEIRLRYRQQQAGEATTLVLRIQPNEGVEVDIWAKRPGYDREVQQVPLAFSYSNHFTDLPEAYERVFVDAMRSDHSLFATSEEILETWRILEPIQEAWAVQGDGLVLYKPGSSPETIQAAQDTK